MAALLFACHTQRIVVSGTTPTAVPSYELSRHHFLAGLIDANEEIELRELCPAGVARIETEQEPINVLVSFVTAFIYTPSTVRIHCQQ